ncbi:hypothetical protein [Leptospira santarosai]|uniref:hypothetical protein n=1 Tax=Leptospira santarosai TaxID=28183 RepID=UPI0007747497|nr:hypothetical protein [Leptospira santarosai]
MKVAFLLGAGFSYDLGMPLGIDLTNSFFDLFSGINDSQLIEGLLSLEQEVPLNKRAISKGIKLLYYHRKRKTKNYEHIFAQIEELALISKGEKNVKDSYRYLLNLFYEAIYSNLMLYQNISYNQIYKTNFNLYSGLKHVLNENETWFFTLNHDINLELLCIDCNIPATYGDTGIIKFLIDNNRITDKIDFTYKKRKGFNIKNKAYFKNSFGANIVKLHGGLGELDYSESQMVCNPPLTFNHSIDLFNQFNRIHRMAFFLDEDSKIKLPNGRHIFVANEDEHLVVLAKSVLTGGNKYSKTAKIKQGEEKLKLFEDIIKSVDKLIIIGYGFGDQHINFRINHQLVKNKKFAIEIVDPNFKRVPSFIEQFDYDNRIKGIALNTTDWINQFYRGNKRNRNMKQIYSQREKIRSSVLKKYFESPDDLYG